MTRFKTLDFEDSAEATDFMFDISANMNSIKLGRWAMETDRNYHTKSKAALEEAVKAYNAFLEIMESAC